MKIDFSVFGGRTIQNTITILNMYNNLGITEVRKIITDLYEEIEQNLVAVKKSQAITKKEIKEHERKLLLCPACKGAFLYDIINYENLDIWGCRKCRYSEIRGEK